MYLVMLSDDSYEANSFGSKIVTTYGPFKEEEVRPFLRKEWTRYAAELRKERSNDLYFEPDGHGVVLSVSEDMDTKNPMSETLWHSVRAYWRERVKEFL